MDPIGNRRHRPFPEARPRGRFADAPPARPPGGMPGRRKREAASAYLPTIGGGNGIWEASVGPGLGLGLCRRSQTGRAFPREPSRRWTLALMALGVLFYGPFRGA